MKTEHAILLADALAKAIADAKATGSPQIDLVGQLAAQDDQARAELEAAIAALTPASK
jgi:ApbE superfamily uncharacterized protein (UPF0280 family)